MEPVQNECHICQCDMGHPDFVTPGELQDDAEVSDTVFRLKCGHAFHNGCLCRALRYENACPVCRSAAVEEERGPVFHLTLGENGLTITNGPPEEDSDVEVPTINLGSVEQMVNLLSQTRSFPIVQHARRKVNEAKSRFRSVETFLNNERKTYLKNALAEFRKKYRPNFQAAKHDLQKALRHLKKIEYEAIRKLDPEKAEETIEQASHYENVLYSAEGHVDTNPYFGPFRRSYWVH
jgi:hypothetical protein